MRSTDQWTSTPARCSPTAATTAASSRKTRRNRSWTYSYIRMSSPTTLLLLRRGGTSSTSNLPTRHPIREYQTISPNLLAIRPRSPMNSYPTLPASLRLKTPRTAILPWRCCFNPPIFPVKVRRVTSRRDWYWPTVMSTKANFPSPDFRRAKALYTTQVVWWSTSAVSKTANSMATAISSTCPTIHLQWTTNTSNSPVATGPTSTANSNKAQKPASAQSTSPKTKSSAAA